MGGCKAGPSERRKNNCNFGEKIMLIKISKVMQKFSCLMPYYIIRAYWFSHSHKH